ncbi:hypothetical protein BJF85_20470 [Saccharomonospora sp. CUA-673]|uniref:nucleotidyltransferase family protein n=1 Tax=Saccharomonospora sp. CUA-673 TaxID=1904969 RepID=UPI00095A83DE|nr:nucleotidyltransferase domain-containing protein [Saccharomonospora sp. CUA-673]OLT44091.1 hypothetical protein BJF85_20470 [Saccharomonospora sp. CUA-673]
MSMVRKLDTEAIAELCQRHYVKSLTLFGSALRDDFDPDRSDYDFLVEFLDEAPSRIRAWMRLKDDLERLLGRDVDLIIGYDFSNPYFAADVASTRQDLYAA